MPRASSLRDQIASRNSTTRVRPSLPRARSRTGRSRGACGKAPRWSGEPRPCPPPERDSSGRPDILIEEASGWLVVIEAKVSNHAAAEKDAKARLGRIVASTGRQIETSIALVYPPAVRSPNGAALRKAINSSNDLEYVLCTHRPGESPDRMPSRGWIRGSVRDLAVLVHRAAAPPPRIEELAKELEDGVRFAAVEFTRRHAYGSQLGANVASVLGQSDDDDGQTRRMAMTVIANALVFHESLAEVQFQVKSGKESGGRAVRPVESFRNGGVFDDSGIRLEWERILAVNYWPIFWSAKEMLGLMPTATASGVLVLQRRVMRKHAQVFFFSYGHLGGQLLANLLVCQRDAGLMPTATASGVLVLQRRVMRKHAQVFFFSYGPFIMGDSHSFVASFKIRPRVTL